MVAAVSAANLVQIRQAVWERAPIEENSAVAPISPLPVPIWMEFGPQVRLGAGYLVTKFRGPGWSGSPVVLS